MRQTTENDDGGQLEHEHWRTMMAFFVFGALIYAAFSLIIAAAQDILAGTFFQSSMVLATFMLPYFLVSLLAPYFMQKIPYFARITTFGLACISGNIILAFAKQVHWKLVGVGVTAFGLAIGEATVLALTSFYHEATSSAFSAGTGSGYLIAPLYYTGG